MRRCSRPVSAETRSRTSVLPPFRLSGSAEPKSERAAPVFVTGWKSRESLSAARRGEYRHGYRRSEDHPQRLARHPLQQAGAQPGERPAREGRRLDRGAGRGHRPTHAAAEPQRPARSRRRRPGDRHVRGARPAAGASGRSNCWSSRSAWPRPRPCPAWCARAGIAEEDSLAENVQRVALHPLDQFRAFQALRDKGLGDEEIAARFFVTPTVVKQRLRLAAVSDKLLDIYAEDGMTLEQLMAFTVTNDHARQEQVWDAVIARLQQGALPDPPPAHRGRGPGRRPARAVRRRSTPIEAAGGVVMRDLFQHDDGGWLQDPALARSAGDREAPGRGRDACATEGWKWIAVADRLPLWPHRRSAPPDRRDRRPHRGGARQLRRAEGRTRSA